MTPEILLLLVLLTAAVVFFVLEWVSVDVVTMGLIALLVIFGILSPEEAYSGFASEIVIVLASIFVLSGALVKTGVMDWMGQLIHRMAGGSVTSSVVWVMILCAGTSAFINNTTATAILIPAVLAVCRRRQSSPSQLLIPLAFASMLGGTCTLIGTSTNLAASGLLQKAGMEPFSLFEFFWLGSLMVATGVAYMGLLGYRLLPKTAVGSPDRAYQIDDYLSEILLPEGSPLAGKTLLESSFAELGVVVRAILRGDHKLYPESSSRLEERDVLLVQASRENLLALEEGGGLTIRASGKLKKPDFEGPEIKTIEAIVMPQSILTRRTLRELNFRRRFGVSVLAIYRAGHSVAVKVSDLPLQVGDVLLLEGSAEQLDSLQGSRDLWVLGEVERIPFRRRRGTYALLALGSGVLLGGLHVLPLSVAFLLAVLAVIGLKCITAEELYTLVEWRMIILIGGMTSFGVAMQKTQAADFLAGLMVEWALPLGVHFLLAAFVLLTMALTQPMSNAAAALVVLPVALSTAAQLELNPRTFAVLITLAASLSFIAPFEPACLLVFGAGKYRFRDFVLAGIPLSLIAALLLIVLVPWMWPLQSASLEWSGCCVQVSGQEAPMKLKRIVAATDFSEASAAALRHEAG